jgi:XTP/dITP diphosphohydrolase
VKIILATRNAGKVREVRAALGDLPVDLHSQAEAGVDLEVIEDGETYAENALKKAGAICRASGLPALADDSGVEVDALPGELGVHSARFGGDGLDDAGRNRLLIERLAGVAEEERGGRYVCVLAFCRPGEEPVFFEGELPGRVLEAPRGEGGFGYDPIFYLPGHGCTAAELDLETKNRISHRGLALAAFRRWLAGELKA